MKQLISYLTIFLLSSTIPHILALPQPNSSAINLPTIPSNTTLFSIPAPFDIEFSTTHDFGPPMSEIAIYTLAVSTLEDLCFRDQNAHMPGRPHDIWTLADHDDNIFIEISSQQVRYAIWGLQMTAGAVRKAQFWPIIGRYFWHGGFAGRVDIGNAEFPLDDVGVDLTGANKHERRAASNAAASSSLFFPNSTHLLTTTHLTIIPHYAGAALSARAVFGTAINVMVHAAESGLDTYCLRLTRPEVQIETLRDAHGEPMLRYRHLVSAMALLTRWMVENERFGEANVEVWRRGKMVGRVRVRRRGREGESERV